MWGWVDWIGYWSQAVLNVLWDWVQWIYYNLLSFIYWAIQVLKNVFGWLGQGFRWVIRHLAALRHLNFNSVWSAIKRGYERLRRAFDWYLRRIQEPLDRARRQIMDIYRRFFKPIIRFLDSLRVFTRFIAIFNRKLAAKLDARLWSLEAKVMFPITYMLRRLNSLSSYQRALVTALGYLDRVTLLESLRRDALLVWEVLTNPRGRILAPRTPPPPVPSVPQRAELHDYISGASGEIDADREDVRAWLRDVLGGVI